MNRALLIDEIVREILSCADLDLASLCRAARTCRAWKDPALDAVWRYLPSVKPFLDLVSRENASDARQATVLRSYARRVRYIAHRAPCHLPSALSSDSIEAVFPNLESVRASAPFLPSTASLFISPFLRQLDLDLGFKMSTQANDLACSYLREVTRLATHLETLRIRGAMTAEMNDVVASMSSLKSLSLRTRSSLTMEALSSIFVFPDLENLELRVDHLSEYKLQTRNGSAFPFLRHLRIRGRPELLEDLLESIPVGQLRTLHVELITSDVKAWAPIFNAVKSKAPTSLQELTIEHEIDLDDIQVENATATNTQDSDTQDSQQMSDTSTTNATRPRLPDSFTLSDLAPLSHLQSLRKLVFDTTLPPSPTDAQMKKIVKWWPHLVHLDLGTLPSSDCDGPHVIMPKLTLAALQTIAEGMKELRRLVIPLDVCIPPPLPVRATCSSSSLKSLTVSFSSAPEPAPVASFLNQVFPALYDVEGSAETQEAWEQVHQALRA